LPARRAGSRPGAAADGNPISRALDRWNAWFDRMADRYRGVIGWALDHRGLMLLLIAACFAGAIALQALWGGTGFAPASDRSETVVTLEAPPGSNLAYTRAKAEQGRPLSAVMGVVNRRIARLQLPPGVTISQGGDVKSQNEIFGSIFAALGLAVLLMYLILVVQFGSFLDPLAILLSLPLSLIGVVLALLLTGDTLNIMSLIGVILRS
jgi:multidrug efflux pump subunit AcrB